MKIKTILSVLGSLTGIARNSTVYTSSKEFLRQKTYRAGKQKQTSEQIRNTGEEIHYITRKSKKIVYNNSIIWKFDSQNSEKKKVKKMEIK